MKNIGRILLFAALVCLALGFCLGCAAFADTVQVGTWAELQAALNSAGTDQTNPTALKLTADITAGSNDGPLTVKSNTYVTMDLNSKTIDRGLTNAAAAANGNVITVEIGGDLTLFGGGIITGGNKTEHGGGVYVSGTLTMSGDGATIMGNTAKYGGGVCIDDGGLFTMDSGTISGNEAKQSSADGGGGGVYVANSTFKLSGAPDISGNTLKSGAASEVYLREEQVITIADALTNASHIGIAMDSPGMFTSGWSAKMGAAAPAAYFASTNSGYHVRTNGGEAELYDPTASYTVTIAEGIEHGSVSVDGEQTSFYEGDVVTLSVQADEHCYLVYNSLSVSYLSGNQQTAVPVTQGTGDNANKWTFTMPAADVTVSATFSPDRYYIRFRAELRQGGTELATVWVDYGVSVHMWETMLLRGDPDGFPTTGKRRVFLLFDENLLLPREAA